VLTAARAQAQFVEGTDYDRLPTALSKEAPGKIEVMEFFAYWCPHCNEFDPRLNEWATRQPSDVVLLHTPWAYQDSQVPYQRLFYILEELGREKELRARVFAAIHTDHIRMDTVDQQAAWAAKNGIDAQKFRQMSESFSVQTSVRRASQLAINANVSGVPTLMVEAKYVIGSRSDSLQVADFLIAQTRKQGGKKA